MSASAIAAKRMDRRSNKELLSDTPRDHSPVESSSKWTTKGWVLSLCPALSDVVATALAVTGEADEFAALRSLCQQDIEARLMTAGLSGLAPIISEHLVRLRAQAAATGAKFSDEEGTFELAFGSTESFYGGLEAMIGPGRLCFSKVA